ncbi:MFS transporter [Pseudorhodobacter sp. MZDSW-24AT]|uniref:MFS transporter n=1 Tax=Pseudorhodobacter sp. MZDSW-24AT TaxID=2052957 RepID=UPI000C1F5590|nr:MFS transporter [Pseudorhodobacter sp. MZDSW-24AT]PJF08677.1 MFS transporter [Pseudorhodobacter sp. MZDSW-24AT]
MRAGIAALLGAYVLSQFYRAFLAVLTPVLDRDLGATASDLAAASGLWFLAFALMQIPVGEALDRVGPRLTTAVLMGIGALGAAIFATAAGPGAIKLAMVLIGMGCSSVLMASYYIFARSYAPAVFGTLAGATVGIGNLGNIGSSLPLSLAVEALGWRTTLWGLAAITALIALAILLLLRDPPRSAGGQKGNLLDLLKMPALWPMLVMMAVCYAPAASIRGLWVGPLFRDVFGADAAWIGQVSLIMGLAMVAGSFAYGPLERALGTRKWLIFGGNALALACILGLWTAPQSPTLTIALLAGLGFAGASFPMVIAHGRAFIPAHLTGRGVTLLNLFGIAPVGLLQLATGRLHAATPADPASAPYTAIFGFIALLLAAGLLVYAFSQDRTD